MYQFRIMLLCILAGLSVYYRSLQMLAVCVMLAIVWAISIPIYRNSRTSAIKEGVENKNIQINVNRANWWEIALLPGISDAYAKKAVWNKKKDGRYSSIDNFFTRNPLNNRTEIENFIEV